MDQKNKQNPESESCAAQSSMQPDNSSIPEGTVSIPILHKYVDRSNDFDSDTDIVSEGAVWHGPAYTPEDDEEERRRVRAIIEQNVPSTEQEEIIQEVSEVPVKKKFWQSSWFVLLCLLLFPPLGIILLWVDKKFKFSLRIGLTATGILLTAGIVFAAVQFSHTETKADQVADDNTGVENSSANGQASTGSGPVFANYPDKTEDEIRAESFPRGEALPTPAEFFLSKTAYSDYAYYYFYVSGIFTGYDSYAGTNYAIIETVLGKIMLLDAMFTLPEFETGDELYFYYLYIGYDKDLDAVFGAYVDYSLENEGMAESKAYQEGTYVVGEDLEAGEYFFYPNSGSAAIQVFGDKKYIEKILSESFDGGYFLTIEDGEILIVENAQFTDASSVELSIGSTLYAYMYRVGTDIVSGTYRLTPDGIAQARYILYDSSDARLRQIVDSGDFDRQIIITVEDGQYLHLIHCYGASYTSPIDNSDSSSMGNETDTDNSSVNSETEE